MRVFLAVERELVSRARMSWTSTVIFSDCLACRLSPLCNVSVCCFGLPKGRIGIITAQYQLSWFSSVFAAGLS